MHFTITYDVKTANKINKEKIKNILKHKKYIEPIEGHLMISIKNTNEYSSIFTRFIEIGNLICIISPVITTADYNGILNPDKWVDVNIITRG